MAATVVLRWYRVALLAHGLVYDEVQARNPDAAIRLLMRSCGLSFANFAHVQLLGHGSRPTIRRQNIRIRLPRMEVK